ncbi:MAG: hypothetical protein E7415_06880 [Ruminococcaceae bacterium]|nr:hypothetical protein [Oscillospiraceae bacterium]
MKIMKIMRKTVSVVLCFMMLLSLITVANASDGEYSLLNGNYVRLLGRGEIIENSRTFNWPNAGFEFEFSGSKAEVYADAIKVNTDVYNGNYFNVAVYNDDTLVRVTRLMLTDGWNTIYEEQNGDPSLKKIMLVRSSEACRGTIRMSKLRTDATPSASSPREKLIEFIGDSFTAGYGNSPALSTYTGYCAENTDNWNSYTGMVARYYGADNNVIAHQGKGVYANRSLEKLTHTMSHQFEYEDIYTDPTFFNMSTAKKHNFYKYQPQLVTVWLGTNDSAVPVDLATFKTAYEALLDNIRAKYPNASILNMAITGSTYCDTIESVVADRGEDNKCYMLELDKFTTTSLGHPDIAEDQRIANQIIAKIDSIKTVWNVPLVGENDTQLLSMRADYNTGKVAVFGNTSYSSDYVSLVVMKPNTSLDEALEKENIAFFAQSDTENGEEYSFEFSVDKLAGEYTLYLNSYHTDNLQAKEFVFSNVIPTITVTSNGNTVSAMSDISSAKDIKVTLSGFDVPDTGFEGMLALAQYSGGVLTAVKVADASKDSQAYGDEVILDTTVDSSTDSIRVFYMNKNTLAPLFGTYDIK